MAIQEIKVFNENKIAKMTLQDVKLTNGERMVLEGRPAIVEANKPLAAEYRTRFGSKTASFDDESGNERIRETVCEIWPNHVFTGWNDVEADNVTPHPFSVQEVRENLLYKLDIYTLTAIFYFFTTPGNFRDVLTKQDGFVLGNESGE